MRQGTSISRYPHAESHPRSLSVNQPPTEALVGGVQADTPWRLKRGHDSFLRAPRGPYQSTTRWSCRVNFCVVYELEDPTMLVLACLAALGADTVGVQTVQADVRALMDALDQAYVWELHNHSSGGSARIALRSIPDLAPLSRRELCGVIGSMLGPLHGTTAQLPDEPGRCVSWNVKVSRGALRFEAADQGANLALDQNANFLLDDAQQSVPVLAIRRFASPDDPGWNGLDGASETLLDAPAVLLDLRGATGDDPRAVWPLVETWTGGRPLAPLHAIVRRGAAMPDTLRRDYLASGGRPERSQEIWRSLVGPAPPLPPGDGLPDRSITVLVGPGCESACQLVAHTLETYARAGVVGDVNREPSLVLGGMARVVLPGSGIEVSFPTTAYLPHRGRARHEREAVDWHVPWREKPARDALPDARKGLEHAVALHRRLARWAHEEPTACSLLPTRSSWHDLPPAVRRRMSSPWAAGEPHTITVYLELPLDRASAYVGGCPGIEVRSGHANYFGAMSSVEVRAKDYASLSRLGFSDVVSVVSIDRHHEDDMPFEP